LFLTPMKAPSLAHRHCRFSALKPLEVYSLPCISPFSFPPVVTPPSYPPPIHSTAVPVKSLFSPMTLSQFDLLSPTPPPTGGCPDRRRLLRTFVTSVHKPLPCPMFPLLWISFPNGSAQILVPFPADAVSSRGHIPPF